MMYVIIYEMKKPFITSWFVVISKGFGGVDNNELTKLKINLPQPRIEKTKIKIKRKFKKLCIF
jgi:hypothetical protein